MADKIKHPETIGLHGGEYRSDPATTAVAVPIYQTTSYQFKDAETCLLYTSPSPRDLSTSRMPSSA